MLLSHRSNSFLGLLHCLFFIPFTVGKREPNPAHLTIGALFLLKFCLELGLFHTQVLYFVLKLPLIKLEFLGLPLGLDGLLFQAYLQFVDLLMSVLQISLVVLQSVVCLLPAVFQLLLKS